MWNKKPTRFLLYKLLNMFRATLCPSSGADDLVVFFACGVVPWLCRQSDPVGWLCFHWEVCSTTKNTTKSSAPEDAHKVAQNMLSNL